MSKPTHRAASPCLDCGHCVRAPQRPLLEERVQPFLGCLRWGSLRWCGGRPAIDTDTCSAAARAAGAAGAAVTADRNQNAANRRQHQHGLLDADGRAGGRRLALDVMAGLSWRSSQHNATCSGQGLSRKSSRWPCEVVCHCAPHHVSQQRLLRRPAARAPADHVFSASDPSSISSRRFSGPGVIPEGCEGMPGF